MTDGGQEIDPTSWYVFDSQRDAVVDGPYDKKVMAQAAVRGTPIDHLVVNGEALRSIEGDTRLLWEIDDVDVVTDGAGYVLVARYGRTYHHPDPEDPDRPDCDRETTTAWRRRDPARLSDRYSLCQFCDPGAEPSEGIDHGPELASALFHTDAGDVGPHDAPVFEADDEDLRADGSGHVCDACGEGFRTLTKLRLHEKDDCSERETYAEIDPDADDMGLQAAGELLTCRDCGRENPNARYEESIDFADGDYHMIVEFACGFCGFANENRVVMTGVDESDLERLPPHLQPDEDPRADGGHLPGAAGGPATHPAVDGGGEQEKIIRICPGCGTEQDVSDSSYIHISYRLRPDDGGFCCSKECALDVIQSQPFDPDRDVVTDGGTRHRVVDSVRQLAGVGDQGCPHGESDYTGPGGAGLSCSRCFLEGSSDA